MILPARARFLVLRASSCGPCRGVLVSTSLESEHRALARSMAVCEVGDIMGVATGDSYILRECVPDDKWGVLALQFGSQKPLAMAVILDDMEKARGVAAFFGTLGSAVWTTIPMEEDHDRPRAK